MTARDELINLLCAQFSHHSVDGDAQDHADATDITDQILATYAHELAEKIRAWVHEPLTDAGAEEYGSTANVLEAADLIDPKLPEEECTVCGVRQDWLGPCEECQEADK